MDIDGELVNWDHFGEFLQSVRLHHAVSQAQFAELLGCDRIYLWRLENGKRKPSNLFLHNLVQSCELTEVETHLVAAFRSLRC
jgi:transcriptional regulator with XRE-family HTH domain